MFSKSRINEPGPKADAEKAPARAAEPSPSFLRSGSPDSGGGTQVTNSNSAASVLAADLTVTGNLKTTGDIVIEGNVDGDIRAHLLTVGETATIRGEVVADDIVINGRVIGRVRGLKVRLTSSAQVEGDIIHKTIAIESGAHFEGSVQRQDDPLGTASQKQPAQQAQPAAAKESPAGASAAPKSGSGGEESAKPTAAPAGQGAAKKG